MTASKKALLLLLGLGYAVILAASLYQRFSQPSLTRHALSSMAPQEGSAAADIGALMQAAAANPQDRAPLIRLTRALMALGQWEGAENFALKALNLDDPEHQDEQAAYLLAVIHHNQGRHKEAAELLEKLLTKSDNPSARYSLGILYLHYLNQPDKGIEQLEKGLLSQKLTPALKAALREELGKARLQQTPAAEPGTTAGAQQKDTE
ncbi:MAG: tetratricopeptide repeat protein [Desulfovibrio sp.]|nr:tetratricopeptide repeat protein [Desulfovibrio sp.]